MPEILAVCVCAYGTRCNRQGDQKSGNTKRKQYPNGETHEEPPLPARAGGKGCPRVRDRFRLSRLRTPSVSWLGGTAPRGLPAPEFRAVARAEFFPPYSRAAATVLHRLPGTESAVIVAERFEWRGLQPAGFELARTKPRRLKPALPNPPNFADAPSLQLTMHGTRGTAAKKIVLRNVLAAARAQIHARPSGGTQFHIQRCVKHLLQ